MCFSCRSTVKFGNSFSSLRAPPKDGSTESFACCEGLVFVCLPFPSRTRGEWNPFARRLSVPSNNASTSQIDCRHKKTHTHIREIGTVRSLGRIGGRFYFSLACKREGENSSSSGTERVIVLMQTSTAQQQLETILWQAGCRFEWQTESRFECRIFVLLLLHDFWRSGPIELVVIVASNFLCAHSTYPTDGCAHAVNGSIL